MQPREIAEKIERVIERIHNVIYGEVVDRTPGINNKNWDIISKICTEESTDPYSIARIMGYRVYDIEAFLQIQYGIPLKS